ncbi:MAG: proprotein convertase P-domain-containing protein, partial [Anaerolineales bacterium]|nr:proprotein convertase P-domain-containing protein [Anaerolineales bacterium]
MKRFFGPVIGTLLTFSLIALAPQHASASTPLKSQCPAFDPGKEYIIPEDGTWLCVSWLDANAPAGTTISEARLKVRIDHPAPEQLEIDLQRTVGSQASQRLKMNAASGQISAESQAFELDSFVGEPAQGEWQLWLRDLAPGQAGWLQGFSFSLRYAPVGKPLVQLQGSPGQPASLQIAPGVVVSEGFDEDKILSPGETPEATLESVDNWQTIESETYEGAFPLYGWEVLDDYPDDGKEYKWDDDDYRPHTGAWAAWPANEGANRLDPATSDYPPYMSSWMIYGPIDLSDATTAEVSFWLWQEIETNYDHLFFGVSHDHYGTYSGSMWDGFVDWEEQSISLDDYIGDASVWIGWRFYSDDTVQYEGPWVDDVLIRKYVPGQVTAQGTLFYSDRNGQSARARFTKVYLYDDDPGGTDDQLATTTTDANGFFQFPALTNWDTDDADPEPGNRRLDLYVVWEADVNDSSASRRRVTDLSGNPYNWNSYTSTNASDGTLDFSTYIPSYWSTLGSMWIFQDLRRAWEYFRDNTSPQADPGSVTARWEKDNDCYPFEPGICSSFFYAGIGGPFIFIAQRNLISADAVVHEAGHHYMYNLNGWWLWWNIDCYYHNVFSLEDTDCSWSEGWADFFALVANGDPCYDFGIGPCTGIPDQSHYDLENHSLNDNPQNYPFGDKVEGRVAGSLYDLFDSANESYDSASFDFAPIADLVVNSPA